MLKSSNPAAPLDDGATKEEAITLLKSTADGSWFSNYLTPPRRKFSRKRFRHSRSSSMEEVPWTTPSQDSSEDEAETSVVRQQQPQNNTVLIPVAKPAAVVALQKEEEAVKTGLFRRLRNRRARKLAEYEQACLMNNNNLPSPPSSGNSFLLSNSSHHNNNNSRKNKPRRFRCIPAEHPFKLLWDTLTVFLSLLNAYYTHIAIRDRSFDVFQSFKIVTEVWFLLDIFLNFVTEHRIGNVTLKTVRAVSARYLTTWFVIDVISLVPGEALYVKPAIDRIKSRKFFQRWFFRTKAVSKVTGKLLQRWSTVRQCATVYTKHKGPAGMRRLIRRLIKYLPKYVLFLKHMKGVVAVRLLRQVHWFRNLYGNLLRLNSSVDQQQTLQLHKPGDGDHDDDGDDDNDDETYSLTFGDDDDEYVLYSDEMGDDDDDSGWDYDYDGDPY